MGPQSPAGADASGNKSKPGLGSISGVSPFPYPTATGSGLRVGVEVGVGANVAVGEGVGFDSPPHATETTSDRTTIVTNNGDHCMTKRAPPLQLI